MLLCNDHSPSVPPCSVHVPSPRRRIFSAALNNQHLQCNVIFIFQLLSPLPLPQNKQFSSSLCEAFYGRRQRGTTQQLLQHAVQQLINVSCPLGPQQQTGLPPGPVLIPHSQWRSQDLEVGGTGCLGNGSPQRGPGTEPLVGGSGGTASRKLIAVIEDIWLPNHAQFCVFSSAGPINGCVCVAFETKNLAGLRRC